MSREKETDKISGSPQCMASLKKDITTEYRDGSSMAKGIEKR